MPDHAILPEIISVEDRSYHVSKLGFTDLCYLYGTGRSFIKVGDKATRPTGYRYGVMTRIDDLELSLWEALIRDLIRRSGEEALLQALMKWAAASCPWLRSSRETELYALELHSSRIFDNPKWVAYEELNQEYRPKCSNNKEVTHESEEENR